VRYVLCDNHRLFVEPFAAALGRRGHDVIVVTRPEAAVRAVLVHRPDVCVLDLKFPEGDSFDALAEMRQRVPACRVVILSGTADIRDAARAAAAGAAGFLRKDQPISALFTALDRIAAGGTVAPTPQPLRSRPSDEHARVRQAVAHLTEREREVLSRLVSAEDTVGIARALGVAPSTARTHLQNVLLKLGVHNRLQAVALVVGAGVARELGHLPPRG
jgi:two-component system, NarL family, nitrate/nitrite response regulator NarL